MLSCIICQDGITENDTNNYPWVLSCGHVYHKLCFERSHNKNCPKCRKPDTRSFRLYPDYLNNEESFTCLLEGIQSAQEQFIRQRKLNNDKAAYTLKLENMIKDIESKNTALRTGYVMLANKFKDGVTKMRAEITKLRDEKTRLNEELNKATLRVSELEPVVLDLNDKLQLEKEQKEVTTHHMHVQIASLSSLLGKAEREKLMLTEKKDSQIKELEDLVNELLIKNDEAKRPAQQDVSETKKELSARESDRDPKVIDATKCDRSLSRKRKISEDIAGPSTAAKLLKKHETSDSSDSDTSSSDTDTDSPIVEEASSSRAKSPPTKDKKRKTMRRSKTVTTKTPCTKKMRAKDFF